MSDYRGIDLSVELQSMYDSITKVKDNDARRELLENLENLQEEISERSKLIREVMARLKSL